MWRDVGDDVDRWRRGRDAVRWRWAENQGGADGDVRQLRQWQHIDGGDDDDCRSVGYAFQGDADATNADEDHCGPAGDS